MQSPSLVQGPPDEAIMFALMLRMYAIARKVTTPALISMTMLVFRSAQKGSGKGLAYSMALSRNRSQLCQNGAVANTGIIWFNWYAYFRLSTLKHTYI